MTARVYILLLRIMDLLLLRILNSINYDCPCIHFIVAQYYFQYFANFLHPSFIIQSIILHFANFLQSSLIDQGLLHFANVIHLSIDQGFFAFREYLTFIFSSIRPFFCISRISYIHLFIDQGFFLHISKFIHPFLSLRNIIFSISRIFYIHHSSIRALSYISRPFYNHH